MVLLDGRRDTGWLADDIDDADVGNGAVDGGGELPVDALVELMDTSELLESGTRVLKRCWDSERRWWCTLSLLVALVVDVASEGVLALA